MNENTRLLIVGLGNPGKEHENNRHNVGFHCLDRLAEAHGLSFDRRRHKAKVASGEIAGRKVVLLKPQTFVNCSGEAVSAAASFYRVPAENILAIYDDLDLPQGTIRLRPRGGSGGHNGVKSLIEQLGTAEFPRLRVGIGRPPGRMEPRDYVLQDFTAAEREVMEEVYGRVVEAVETFICHGISEAMNRFNARPRRKAEEKR